MASITTHSSNIESPDHLLEQNRVILPLPGWASSSFQELQLHQWLLPSPWPSEPSSSRCAKPLLWKVRQGSNYNLSFDPVGAYHNSDLHVFVAVIGRPLRNRGAIVFERLFGRLIFSGNRSVACQHICRHFPALSLRVCTRC